MCFSTEAGRGGERCGLCMWFPPPHPTTFAACFSSKAAEKELLEGRETICDESFGFVKSLPRIESKCILTYVLFLGKGVWI